MNNISELVIKLSKDPFNPQINFECAVEYEKLRQTASAVSFYLRTAEYGDDILVYNSLLKVAACMHDQNDRIHTVSNCILQAISYMPKRPEGYFLMSQFHERSSNWQESYTWAEMGLSLNDDNFVHLPADVGYKGKYSLEFEKGISAWCIGRKDESKEILTNLLNCDIADEYRNAILYNLEKVNNVII